jgi:hypothetical protein
VLDGKSNSAYRDIEKWTVSEGMCIAEAVVVMKERKLNRSVQIGAWLKETRCVPKQTVAYSVRWARSLTEVGEVSLHCLM